MMKTMEQGTHHQNLKDLQLQRRLLLIAGAVYFFWWFAVNLLLPESFNPFLGRAVVVGTILGVWGLSFQSEWGKKHLRTLFMGCVWLITLHYFYLFWGNNGEVNWVIGAYITVTAIGFCFPTGRSLLAYSSFVLLLSGILIYLVPTLRTSVYLPGLFTILLQAYVGLIYRQRAERAKISELAMAENVRLRDEFISLASHELRTPVAALKLQTQLVDRGLERGSHELTQPAKLKEFISLFERQVDRLSELVETMFDVSRISTGKFEIHLETINLPKVFRDITSMLSPDKKALVHLKVPQELLINADSARLTQVFENLLSNAFKFGEGKPVEIVVGTDGSVVKIEVKDQGIGIPPDAIEKIFNRFERAESSKNIGGMGLGLYIARQIVEAHHGKIRVDSKLGVGTTMTVTLPLAGS